MHYVIVGNGVCGIEAALGLRQRDAKARISIVSDEHDHFFSRPALMYVFAGQTRLQDTEPFDRQLYERMGFERVSGRVARRSTRAAARSSSRTAAASATTSSCSRSAPRRVPLPGRGPRARASTTSSPSAISKASTATRRKGGRAVVIGGGLIGVEVAEILHDRGLHVTFLIRENWYFPLALDGRESALVAEHMRAHGVDVRLGINVEGGPARPGRPAPGGQGRRLRGAGPTSWSPRSGWCPTPAFLAGGCSPSSQGGAIEVDDALRTGAPDVWAAGDCANVTWADGSRRPEQLWYTARDQGRIAALSMLGDEVAYRRGAWYNSAKFFDLEWTTAGWVPPS